MVTLDAVTRGDGEERRDQAAPYAPPPPPTPAANAGVFAISAALAVLLLVELVHLAGLWSVAANTRFLDLLIRAGVVQLTDMDAGYIVGVPDHELYLRSQDPVDWVLLVGCVALYVGVWLVRTLRFRAVAAAVGLEGTPARHTRVAMYGEAVGRFLPFDLGESATASALEADGAERDRAHAVVHAQRVSLVAEIAIYGCVALVIFGVGPWLRALSWSLGILAAAHLLARTGTPASRRARREQWSLIARDTVAHLWRSPARLGVVVVTSVVALPLEELIGYQVAQALSSENVLLAGITPSMLLMALVAGKTAALVPVTPGGIGQFEWGFAAALVALGEGLAEAVTVTLVFSAVRYVAAALVLAATAGPRELGTSARVAVRYALTATGAAGSDGAHEVGIRPVPRLDRLVWRVVVLGCVVYAVHLIGRVRLLLVDFWLFESMGFESVFWTNLRMQALLFTVAGGLWAAAVIVPGVRYRRPGGSVKRTVVVGALVGTVAGTTWAGTYQRFLLWRHGRAFGDDDPVFGHDIGFYVFDLPAIRSLVWGAFWLFVTALVVAVVQIIRRGPVPTAASAVARLRERAGQVAEPMPLALVVGAGVSATLGLWLRRFDVLVRDNEESSIATGAEALDVTGLFSTVNMATVQAVAALASAAAIVVVLRRCRAGRPGEAGAVGLKPSAAWLATPVAVVVLAAAIVSVRDATSITPNEPVIQLEYLHRHIEATNRAWGMDAVEIADADLNGADDPLPDLDRVLSHPSVTNVQLWPGAASWLERLLDPQHVNRLHLETAEGAPDMVFGATLDTFRQHQKLRPYYDFLDVDVVNYPDAGGTPRLVTSAVRELPLLEPQPWLAYWGQRFVLFTHGYGVVAAPLGDADPAGGPAYVSSDIPPVAGDPQLAADRHAVYYGEGSGTIAFTNVRGVPELDHPTDQGRADVFFPAEVDAGVRVDSLLKRLAFAWGTQESFGVNSFLDIAFSDLITNDTRIHYRRQPLDRVAAIAPFLYLDSDPYAVVADGGISWMVNGMTVSDRYPYSAYGELGDKSVRRGPFATDVREVNYAADSVKATVDAYTGEVRLYRISDEPVVATWADVYPDLFTPAGEMPEDVRAQQQYPPQLFHVQFDDLWIYYHVADPIAFFNQEDLFDDADEVLGPMVEPGKGITFSIEPYPTVVETGGDIPDGAGEYQFAMSQVFTPEAARNLRAIVNVHQQGDDYGRLSVLQLPKGSFAMGPEQAEAVIDQTADIAQQFGFWSTTGVEVIRGYITPLIIDDELIYVEPVFIRSAQNPFPQLARVVAVVRGQAAMAPTLDEALRGLYGQLQGAQGAGAP